MVEVKMAIAITVFKIFMIDSYRDARAYASGVPPPVVKFLTPRHEAAVIVL